MKRFIEVSKEDKAFLMKAFKISDVMVYYALYFDEKRGNSDLAKRIRNLAMQRGGKMMLLLPECDTIHTSNGMMIQKFDNGYEITADKRTGLVQVWKGKNMVDQQYECTIKRLTEIQNCIENGGYDCVMINTEAHPEFSVAK